MGSDITIIGLEGDNVSRQYDIKEVVKDGYFNINKWSAFQGHAMASENQLKNYGEFKVYIDFYDFLEHNDYLLEDADMTIEEVAASEDSYKRFINHIDMMDRQNDLKYDDTDKEVLVGIASDENIHFTLTHQLHYEIDLIVFVNEVLRDAGLVTHSSGLKQEYEAICINEVI